MGGHLRPSLTSVALTLGLVGWASLGSAAEAQVSQPGVSSAGQLEEIIVTARKQEERLQATPLSVSAFSAATLEKQNIVTIDRIGNLAPNLEITQAAGTGTAAEVYMRGIGEADYELYIDPPVSIYIDGVLNARSAAVLLDLVDLERVEVLRGPQGTLFGRNTTGGAINIFTKGPSDTFGIQQKLGYGSDDEFISRTILNTGALGDTGLKAKFAFFHHERDGWIRDLNVDRSHDPGKLDSNGIWFALHGDLADNLSFDYKLDYTDIHDEPITAEMTVARPDIINYFSKSPSFGGDPFTISPSYQSTVHLTNEIPDQHSELLGHSLTVDYDVNDALRFKNIAGYRSLAMDEHPPEGEGNLKGLLFDPATGQVSVGFVNPFDTIAIHDRQYQISEELQIIGTVDRFKYVAGLFFFEELGSGKNPNFFTFVSGPVGVNITTNRIYGLDSKSYAAYGQTSYTPPLLDDRFELTFGLRYTRDEKTLSESDYSNGFLTGSQNLANNWHNLSWATSLNYRWADSVMSYVRVSTGYKSGGYNPGALQPPYNPEKAIAYELGVKSDWFDKRLRVNAAVFQTNYDDLQIDQFVLLPSGTEATIVTNAGKAVYRGGEIELTALIGRGWQLDGTFGYVDPQYETYLTFDPASGRNINVASEGKFPYVSKATFNIGIQYEFEPFSVGDLTARLDYAFKSARVFFPLNRLNPFNDQIASNAYHDLSARLILDHIPLGSWSKNLKAELWGTNLLDRHERVAGIDFGALGFGTNTYNRPLAIGFDVTADF